jgi:uncharacterized membrane protein
MVFLKCLVCAFGNTFLFVILLVMLAFLCDYIETDRKNKNQLEMSNSKFNIMFFLVCVLHVCISSLFFYCLSK